MAEVRRRTATKKAAAPVTRRRDRAAEEPEEEDEVEATTRRAPRKAAAAKKAPAKTTTRRRPPPEPEPEEDEYEDEEADEDEEDWDDEEEETEEDEEGGEDEDEEEPEPTPRRKKAAATKKAAPSRRRSPRAPEPDDDDDEEETPRRRSSSRATKAKSKLPPGVYAGDAGVERLRKERGDGSNRLTLTNDPELIKFLQPEPVATFGQHWVSQGGGGGNRPYTCPVEDCPLCELGDRANQVVIYNVLHLSADDAPKNMVLALGVKATGALKDAATLKKGGTPNIERDFFTASKSGQNQQTQTNFRSLKLRDIEEDWDELFDDFDPEDLPDIIADAKENVFTIEQVVQVSTAKQLREVAAYLAED
jgi:hypothetical protein